MNQENMTKKIMLTNKERIILLCLTLLVLVINIRHLGSLGIFTALNDELGYWGNAAYLAGLDWSSIISKIPYYSYGYSMLLVPLFYIFDNPVHMYKAAIFFNGMMLCISFLLCYSIAKKLATGIDNTILMAIAFLLSMYPAYIAYSSVTLNECLLILNIWLLTWCFADLDETSSNYRFMLIGFLSMYSYMIHQRALGILMTSIIVITCLKLLHKINLQQVMMVALPIVLLMFMHIPLKENIQTHLWLNTDGNLTNDYLAQASKISQIFTVDGLIKLVKISMGHIFYLGAASYLISYFGLYELFRKVGKSIVVTIRNKKIDIIDDDPVFPLYIFLLIAVLFSLAINIIFMINPTRIDHIVYGRYIDMIMGPIILLGFIAVLNNNINLNKIFGIISINFIVLAIAVTLIVQASGLTEFDGLSAVGLWLMNTPLGVYLPVLTAVLFCRLIIISVLKKNTKMLTISIIMASICSFWIGDYVANNKAVANQNVRELMNIVALIEDAEENMPVYFLWENQGNSMSGDCYTNNRPFVDSYQFLLKDIPIKLINRTELEALQDRIFLLTYPNTKYFSDLRDYEFCLENRYNYLFVSKSSFVDNGKLTLNYVGSLDDKGNDN